MTTDTTYRPHPWPAPPAPSPKSGIKHDDGKLRWTLLPFGALEQVVAVLEYGARRYGVANWREIERPRERYLDALFRHSIAYARGETRDHETGLHHLAHAAVNALFVIWFDLHEEEVTL